MSSETGAGGDRGNAVVQFYRWVLGIGYERNVGGPERTVRYVAGGLSVLLGLGVLLVPVLGAPLRNGVLAVVLVVTGCYLVYEARVQYCPLNDTFGRSTYRGP